MVAVLVANLSYDYGIGFDRDVSFDQLAGPVVPVIAGDLLAGEQTDLELNASDTTPKLASDSDITLQVED